MGKQFFAVCRCQKAGGSIATFCFSGVFRGKRISGIEVHSKQADIVNKGKDYLLALELIQIRDALIICKLIRCKPLE